jgi:hypothetical protein
VRPGARRVGWWPAVFAACVLIAGARSIAIGKDANWDLKNYHWYNAWALLNGRLGWDLAPAQIQTYYNPVGDLPFYFLVHALPWPRHVAFWMALPAAVAAFFLARIVVRLFPPGEGRAVRIAAAIAIGVTGASGQATLGSTMNEWLCAAFLMAALGLAVRALADGEQGVRAFAAGAFLAGCAVGLKLTYGVFGAAFLAALLSFGPWRERARRVAIAAALMLAGCLVFGGYWAWAMWREFGNPTFPYFNHVFHSPWWEPEAFFDRNFGPRSALQWLFFPLYFSRHSLLVSEVAFRDYRLAALLLVALLAAARRLVRGRGAGSPLDPAWRFLAVFTLVAYVAWLKLFGIYRYLVPLELLSGPLVVGGIAYLLRGVRLRYAALGAAAALALALVATTRPGDWGRIAFGHGYFDEGVPRLPPRSLVILGYVHPYAYEIPFFRRDARFVSPANNFLMPGQGNLLARRIQQAIDGHDGPIFLMEMRARHAQDAATLAHFALAYAEAPCRPIRSPMSDSFAQLCPLERLAPA